MAASALSVRRPSKFLCRCTTAGPFPRHPTGWARYSFALTR